MALESKVQRERRGGERIVITISPSSTENGLLRVDEAMQQVIDSIRLFEQAERKLSDLPENAVEWKLESASASSPFRVVALAKSADKNVDITTHVRKVKTEVSHGLRALIERGERPAWLDAEAMGVARNLFDRNQNGIGVTEFDFEMEGEAISITSVKAVAGTKALEAIDIIGAAADLPEREAFGEVEGVMLAAGKYRSRPAIRIITELYGFVWCSLTQKVVEKFGTEHKMSDVWQGKTVGVRGLLSYGVGGKLMMIEAYEIREIETTPAIDLDLILDPDFTSGFSPEEYLDRLHRGELV